MRHRGLDAVGLPANDAQQELACGAAGNLPAAASEMRPGQTSRQAQAHLVPSAARERLLSLGQQSHLDASNRKQVAALVRVQPCGAR